MLRQITYVKASWTSAKMVRLSVHLLFQLMEKTYGTPELFVEKLDVLRKLYRKVGYANRTHPGKNQVS